MKEIELKHKNSSTKDMTTRASGSDSEIESERLHVALNGLRDAI